ncbi:MAG TPA: ribonuclease D [Alphaproteobacteria bacterium]|nr:ribonuclease D [Alphaproteobacteria bacterium]
MTDLNITLHHGDLPADVKFGNIVAMDCEMMGLNPLRDKLCLAQISDNGKDIHLVKFDITKSYSAPNLKALLEDSSKEKIFHFARADMGFLIQHLNAEPSNIFCTKVASKLCRTYTDSHGLKSVLKELLNVELSKEQQTSHWGVAEFSDAQIEYAARDVVYLHQIREELGNRVEQLGRTELLNDTNKFIPVLAKLELQGWNETILNHH